MSNASQRKEADTVQKTLGILNESQRQALDDIVRDLGEARKRKKRIRRVLYGEVGSGKTVVAQLAAYYCQKQIGGQTAIMCPTAALAEQQHQDLNRMRGRSKGEKRRGDTCFVLSGQTKQERETNRNTRIRNNGSIIAIGTHALANCQFPNLVLVVIDEQQKFGTAVRDKLSDMIAPGGGLTLMLTATPIPRTMAQMIATGSAMLGRDEAGSNEVRTSTIAPRKEKRRPVRTHVLRAATTDGDGDGAATRRIADRIKEHTVKNGLISIIVVPAIESKDGKMTDIEWARTNILGRHRVHRHEGRTATIHGRMKDSEKIGGIEALRKRKKDIVICTSIVEVGMHIPRANLVVILNCERFGLAQIHQMRGRVGREIDRGRGGPPPECILVAPPRMAEKAEKRTASAEDGSNEGIDIACEDARQRGPGDLYGTSQHGYTTETEAPDNTTKTKKNHKPNV